jgi:hypothetical protein
MGIPALIGAGIGGAMSAARGGNPLTGALLGGITGGIGSSVLGAASTAAGSGAANTLASGIAAQPALGYAGAQTAAGQAMANPGFFATMKEVPGALGNYIKSNPEESLKLGNSLLGEEQPIQAPSAGIMRGQMAPMTQGQQYSVGTPNFSLI